MSYTINIEITDLEAKVWHHFVGDARELVENFVRSEVDRCFKQVYETESARLLADPEVRVMPASVEEIVAGADLTSAKERDVLNFNKMQEMFASRRDESPIV